MYDLGAQLFSKLQDVDEDFDADEVLVAALALEITNEANPCKRSEQPFLRHVEYLQMVLEFAAIVGTIENCLPNEYISQKMSRKMLLAVLKHIGAHDLHEKHSTWWCTVREDFVVTLKNA